MVVLCCTIPAGCASKLLPWTCVSASLELACARGNTFAGGAPLPVVMNLTSCRGLQMELTLIALTSRPLPLALTRQHLAGELAGKRFEMPGLS